MEILISRFEYHATLRELGDMWLSAAYETACHSEAWAEPGELVSHHGGAEDMLNGARRCGMAMINRVSDDPCRDFC